jgi:hypothetical protein
VFYKKTEKPQPDKGRRATDISFELLRKIRYSIRASLAYNIYNLSTNC